MKRTMTTLLAWIPAMIFAGSLQAALSVTQFDGWTDGNDGGQYSGDVPFDIVNPDSILAVGVYVDGGDTSGLSNVTFGGVAPDASLSDIRSASYLFLNPATDGGLNFHLDSSTGGGLAIILYEISGADLNPGSITSVTASNAIETTTADELIVSFAGRNNNTSATVSGSSIFTTEDIRSNNVGAVRGGGSLASASAIAASIGSQNISWNSASEGRIAFAFEAAVPEPASLALLGVGGLLMSCRRRQS